MNFEPTPKQKTAKKSATHPGKTHVGAWLSDTTANKLDAMARENNLSRNELIIQMLSHCIGSDK